MLQCKGEVTLELEPTANSQLTNVRDFPSIARRSVIDEGAFSFAVARKLVSNTDINNKTRIKEI